VGVEYAVLGSIGVGWCCGVSLMVGWLAVGIVGGLSALGRLIVWLVWLLTFWALIIVVLIAALSVVVVVIVLPLVVIGTLLLLIPSLMLIIELTIILLLPVAIAFLLGVHIHMIVITAIILPLILAVVFVPPPAAATIIGPIEGSRRSCCVGVHFVCVMFDERELEETRAKFSMNNIDLYRCTSLR
jgi:hypothetical protein